MTTSRPVHTTATPARAVAPEDVDLVDCPLSTTDGKPILVVERGLAPHPHPRHEGKLVPFRFLQRIQLGDESIRYRCSRFLNGTDGERCWRDDFLVPRSAVAHINSHGQVRTPDYPEETIRLVLRLVKTFKQAGKRNFCELAAAELNRRKVPTVAAVAWSNEQVSHLYNRYKDEIQVRVSQVELLRLNPELTPATVAPTSPAAPSAPVPAQTRASEVPVPATNAPPVPPLAATSGDVSLAELDRLSSQLLREASDLFDRQKQVASLVAEYVELVGKKVVELAAVAAAQRELDAETLDAARRWREMKRIMAS